MHHAFALLAGVGAGTPTPTPQPTVAPELVTPGPWGFVVIAVLALVVVALVWDMMRRIRRGRVRADIIEELDGEAAAAADRTEPGDDVDEPDRPPPPVR